MSISPQHDQALGSLRSLRWLAHGTALVLFLNGATVVYGESLFSAGSSWNLKVPATATIGSVDVAEGLPVGLDTWDPDGNWVVPFYTAKASEPQVRILFNSEAWTAVREGIWHRSGNTPEVEAKILATSSDSFPDHGNVFSSTSTSRWVTPASCNRVAATTGAKAYVPASNFEPAAGADGHMAIRQPSGDVLETYGTIILSDRTIVALSYGVTDPDGSGDGWQRGQTASMLPSYAGAILDNEIAAGIKHTMSITVPPSLLTPKFTYPAYAFDRDALTNAAPYSGNLPMGTRLALPADFKIGKLQLITKAGKEIANAAQQYGFLIVDRGGQGITIRVRPSTEPLVPPLHTYNRQLSHDLKAIFSRLRVVEF